MRSAQASSQIDYNVTGHKQSFTGIPLCVRSIGLGVDSEHSYMVNDGHMIRLQVGKVEAITVEAAAYDSCMAIIDSDHKPVWSRLQVTLPVVLQDRQRRKCSHLLKDAFLHSLPEPPRVTLAANQLSLHPVSSSQPSAAGFRTNPL